MGYRLERLLLWLPWAVFGMFVALVFVFLAARSFFPNHDRPAGYQNAWVVDAREWSPKLSLSEFSPEMLQRHPGAMLWLLAKKAHVGGNGGVSFDLSGTNLDGKKVRQAVKELLNSPDHIRLAFGVFQKMKDQGVFPTVQGNSSGIRKLLQNANPAYAKGKEPYLYCVLYPASHTCENSTVPGHAAAQGVVSDIRRALRQTDETTPVPEGATLMYLFLQRRCNDAGLVACEKVVGTWETLLLMWPY